MPGSIFHKRLRFFHLQLRGGDGQLKSAVGTEDGAAAGECVLLCAAAGILLLHQRAEQCGSESLFFFHIALIGIRESSILSLQQFRINGYVAVLQKKDGLVDQILCRTVLRIAAGSDEQQQENIEQQQYHEDDVFQPVSFHKRQASQSQCYFCSQVGESVSLPSSQ